jgi:hypothetical protein
MVGLADFVLMSMRSFESIRFDNNKKRHSDHSDVAWRSEQTHGAGQATRFAPCLLSTLLSASGGRPPGVRHGCASISNLSIA